MKGYPLTVRAINVLRSFFDKDISYAEMHTDHFVFWLRFILKCEIGQKRLLCVKNCGTKTFNEIMHFCGLEYYSNGEFLAHRLSKEI